MSTAAEERQHASELRRSELEAADLRMEVMGLRYRLAAAEAKLNLRLTARQTRQILDENHELREMNRVLLARNVVLSRNARRRRPAGTL